MGKFKIPTVSSTTNKTVRFPNNKIDRVDKAKYHHLIPRTYLSA